MNNVRSFKLNTLLILKQKIMIIKKFDTPFLVRAHGSHLVFCEICPVPTRKKVKQIFKNIINDKNLNKTYK